MWKKYALLNSLSIQILYKVCNGGYTKEGDDNEKVIKIIVIFFFFSNTSKKKT
jgi:hypothetical protein